MKDNYGDPCIMSDLRNYHKREKQRKNRRRRYMLRYTNTTQGEYGTNQNKIRQKPPCVISQSLSKEEDSSKDVDNDSVKLEHDNLTKQLELSNMIA